MSGGSISILKTSSDELSRVGLVTPKLVGNSVVRHLVARRIRSAAANVLQIHPYGFDIAVRAVEKSAENQVNYWESEILQAIERLNNQSPKSGLRNE